MLIAIINQSTMVKDADVQTMVQACQLQNTLHVAPAWNQKPATITFYSDKSKVPGYAWLISIIDSESDVPNALGYHSVDINDRVVGFIMCQPVLSNDGVVLYDARNPQNTSVASVLSHEVCEAFADRFCNVWADGPTIKQGSEYAVELCDAVESISYTVSVNGHKVSVSDFVFPSFFNPFFKSPQNLPLDYCKALIEPFTMVSGGYMVVRNGPGTEQQIFGEEMPMWRKEQKKKSQLRRFNRRDQNTSSMFTRVWAWLTGK